MLRLPARSLFLAAMVATGLTGCTEVEQAAEGPAEELAGIDSEELREIVRFREAMQRTIRSAEVVLERLKGHTEQLGGDAREEWADEVRALGYSRVELDRYLGTLGVQAEQHWDTTKEDLLERTADLQEGIDRLELAMPQRLMAFSEAVEAHLAEVDWDIGVLRQEVLMLDMDVAEGHREELRDFETERDEIIREAFTLEDEASEERAEVAEDLVELLDEVREFGYELRWGVDIDPF